MDLVTTDTVLQELNITRPTLRKYCRDGMPYYRAKGSRARYKFVLSEIYSWLSHNQGDTSERSDI